MLHGILAHGGKLPTATEQKSHVLIDCKPSLSPGGTSVRTIHTKAGKHLDLSKLHAGAVSTKTEGDVVGVVGGLRRTDIN